MRLLAPTILSIIMLLSFLGCSTDKPAPTSAEPLDYNVTGDDAPGDIEAAIAELAALGITVPDPVRSDDPALAEDIDLRAAAAALRESNLDDETRERFRRIIGHLHDQHRMLRRCMSQNDDPRLRRAAYGAAIAYQRGLRALRADEPRMALRYFHQANRVMNLALRICREE